MTNLVDKAILRALRLERFKASHLKDVAPIINKLREDVYVLTISEDSPKKALPKINKLIEKVFKKIEQMCLREYKELIVDEIEHELSTTSSTQIRLQKEEQAQEEAEKDIGLILASLILGFSFKQHMAVIVTNLKRVVQGTVAASVADKLPSGSPGRP